MKQHLILLALLFFGLSSCNSQDPSASGYKNLDVAAFKAKMAEPGVVVLDVRTPAETANGMIQGASQLDFEAANFEAEVDKLNKEKTYLVYCQGGGRSSKACKLMAKKGFKNLYNLEDGYQSWTEQSPQ